MKRIFSSKVFPVIFLFTILVISFSSVFTLALAQHRWKVHDWSRPRPPVIDPGTFSTQQAETTSD